MVLVATLEAIGRARPDVAAHLSYTGPALGELSEPVPRPALPRILVSLSTTYLPQQAATIQKIMDALADLPVSVVVTTGPAVDPTELRPPANVAVHGYPPH